MAIYRCSKCGHEAEVAPEYGTEVVSVYCCRHKTQARDQIDPVRMDLMSVPTPTRTAELVSVA